MTGAKRIFRTAGPPIFEAKQATHLPPKITTHAKPTRKTQIQGRNTGPSRTGRTTAALRTQQGLHDFHCFAVKRLHRFNHTDSLQRPKIPKNNPSTRPVGFPLSFYSCSNPLAKNCLADRGRTRPHPTPDATHSQQSRLRGSRQNRRLDCHRRLRRLPKP